LGIEGLLGEQLRAGSRKRLGVLLVAENASLVEGGQSYLPIQWFRGLLKAGVDVHLLVHDRSRIELDQALDGHEARIHYVQDTPLQKIMWEIGRNLPSHVRDFSTGWAVHLITQFKQRQMARELIARFRLDIVHEVAPVAPRLPSMMHGLGVPVVIGPMNGDMSYPPAYRSTRSLGERIFVPVGRTFTNLANYLVPGKRRAALLLVANERTRSALPASCAKRVEILCENGVDPEVWKRPDNLPPRQDDELCFVFLGRLVDSKGVDSVLEVLARVRKKVPKARMRIIGDGPDRKRLETMAKKLGLADVVTFYGWVPPEECPRLLAECDLLVFPSVFDCGGAVVLEAMTLGLSVIALDWGGPSDYLASGGGVLIEPVGRKEEIALLTKAVLSLTPEKRRVLGETARQVIAEQYTWPAKIRQILTIYHSVCAFSEPTLPAEEACQQ
jgi:glycosyltransferase involved in cell wall biosynthesis